MKTTSVLAIASVLFFFFMIFCCLFVSVFKWLLITNEKNKSGQLLYSSFLRTEDKTHNTIVS